MVCCLVRQKVQINSVRFDSKQTPARNYSLSLSTNFLCNEQNFLLLTFSLQQQRMTLTIKLKRSKLIYFFQPDFFFPFRRFYFIRNWVQCVFRRVNCFLHSNGFSTSRIDGGMATTQ